MHNAFTQNCIYLRRKKISTQNSHTLLFGKQEAGKFLEINFETERARDESRTQGFPDCMDVSRLSYCNMYYTMTKKLSYCHKKYRGDNA
jgi:hypothetical protein